MPVHFAFSSFRVAVLTLLAFTLLITPGPILDATCPPDPPPPECDNGGQFPGGRWDLSQISGSYTFSGTETFYPFIDDPELWDDYETSGSLSVSMQGGSNENYIDVGCDGTVTGQGREQITGTLTKSPDIWYYNEDTCINDPAEMSWTVTIDRTYSITGSVSGSGQLDLDYSVDTATLDFSGSLAASFDCIFISGSDNFNLDISGDTEQVQLSGQIDESSTSWSPTVSPRGSKTWVDDVLHRVRLDQTHQYQDDTLSLSPSLSGGGSQPALQEYSEAMFQDAVTITENLNATAEPKTPIITSMSLDEPSQYLEGVDATTTVTAEIDWRGQSPGQVEFTYGSTSETVSGSNSVTWSFDAGESGTTIEAEAIQGIERSETYTIQTPKVSLPGWAGSTGDWSGSSGVSYEATLDWPVSLETTQTLNTISLFTGLWGINGSASSTFNAMANSNGSPGSGDMTTSADFQFGQTSASLTMEGSNTTTLSCDDLTTTGSATATLPFTVWKKTINPVTLVPGIQSAACGLSGFLCGVINSVGIKASADATISGTPTYTGEGSEIRWDGGSLGGSLTGRIGAGASLPPPIASVASLNVSGGATGCIEFQVSPDLELQNVGGELEASASVSFLGLSASAEETWPFGGGCGSRLHTALKSQNVNGFVPADGQLAMDAEWTSFQGSSDRILGVAAWSDLPDSQARPAGDIHLRFSDDGVWGPTVELTSDALSNTAPDVAFDNQGRALVVYARSAVTVPTDTAALATFADGYELHWASIDPANGAVLASGQLTSNSQHDFGPRLRRDAAGELHLFWQRATGTEITGTTNDPVSIHVATWDANLATWGAEQTAASGLVDTLGFSPAAASASAMLIGLTIDEDGDFATADDREIYEITRQSGTWLAPRRVTNNSDVDDAPLAAFDGADPVLLWRRGADILELRADLFASGVAVISDPNALPGETLDGAFAHGLLGSGLVAWNEAEQIVTSAYQQQGWQDPEVLPGGNGATAEALHSLRPAASGFVIVGYGQRAFENGMTSLSALIEPKFDLLALDSDLFADDFESGDTGAWTASIP